jgi:hypothetical protein
MKGETMKYCIGMFLILVLTGCCTDRMNVSTQLHGRIDLYQDIASKAYVAGYMDEYHYWRGVADGVAVSRDVIESETVKGE